MGAVDARTALVTGASGKIGEAIARGLALRGYSVIVVARASSRLDRVARTLASVAPNHVRAEACDVSSLEQIRALARRVSEPLSVLVNNAAQCPRGRTLSSEGVEMQLATNVLGYVRMALAFEPHLMRAAPSRIVNVASYWAGGLDVDDLEFRRRRYDNDAAYRQSKQANRMLTVALAERLAPARITVNSCHPGDVSSQLSSDLGFGGHDSPEEGARTPLHLATSDAVAGESGAYFAACKRARCDFSSDPLAIRALYEACARYGL